MAEATVTVDASKLGEGVDRRKYEDAAARLQAFKRKPLPGTELFRLFNAIDLAEGKSASLYDSVRYLLVLVYMSLVGFLSRLDTRKVIRTLTHNSPSIGHRLRLKSSLTAYSLAVKASVGAQTVTRKVLEDFCQRALGLGPNDALDLDKVIDELRLPPPPSLLAEGQAVSKAPDLRFGDDIAEARMAVEQLLVADVVSSYIHGLDAFVIWAGTLTSFTFTIIATFLIFHYEPDYLLSAALAGPNAPLSCQLVVFNSTGAPTGMCLAPPTPVEDGTSLYRCHIYFAIVIIAVPIVYVCLTGLALQVLLNMVATVMADIDNTQVELMIGEHPKSPSAEHVGSQSRRAELGRRMLAEGTFARRREMHSEAHKSSFLNELLVGRDSTLVLEKEEFLTTFSMMRNDVKDASERVGLNVQNMLTLITQGLAALSVFLLVVNAITIHLGQRLVVIAIFTMATLWVYILGYITRDARVYSFLVLAESSKYLNTVLHIDEAVGGEARAPPALGRLAWPWSEGAPGGGGGGKVAVGAEQAADSVERGGGGGAMQQQRSLQGGQWHKLVQGERTWYERTDGSQTAWRLPPGAQVVPE